MLSVSHGLLLLELLYLQGMHILQKFTVVGLDQTVVRLHQALGQLQQFGMLRVLQSHAQSAPGLGAIVQVLALKPGKEGAVRRGLMQQHLMRGGREQIPGLDMAQQIAQHVVGMGVQRNAAAAWAPAACRRLLSPTASRGIGGWNIV